MARKINVLENNTWNKIVAYDDQNFYGEPPMYFVTKKMEIVGLGRYASCKNGKVMVTWFVKNDEMEEPQKVTGFLSQKRAREITVHSTVQLCGRYFKAGLRMDDDGDVMTNLLGKPIKTDAQFKVQDDDGVEVIKLAPAKKVEAPEFNGEDLFALMNDEEPKAKPKKARKSKKAAAEAQAPAQA